MRRVLVTGAAGALGRAFAEAARGRREVAALARAHLDVTDPAAVRDAFERHRPDDVVHLAAFTDVDRAESEPDAAARVNGFGTRCVAEAARRSGARLLYASTDYVFDGRKGAPYLETDPTGPLGVYGRTKAEGEGHALASEGSIVVRSQALFGGARRSFASAIVDRARAGLPVEVVDGVVTGVAYVPDLASALVALLDAEATGVLHVANSGPVSWIGFARAVLDEFGFPDAPVARLPFARNRRRAPRPAYSYLDSSRAASVLGAALPPWHDALRRFAAASGAAATTIRG